MKGKTLGETLRTLREREKLSVKEVVERLREHGLEITDKTLYSYEGDKRASSAEMLLALCQIYNCNNILETFAEYEPDYSIPDDSEWKLIEKYRSLDSAGKNTIDAVIEQEIERSKEVLELLNQIQELESKLYDSNNEYIPNQETRSINYYYRLASAGTGQIIFDMPPTKHIEIPDLPEYRKADYAIGVNGNSMEPTYYDGDTLLVEMTEKIEIGEIGIFSVNNECYVKKLERDKLISLNPECENIALNETAHCMGRVLGKLKND